MGVVPPGSAHAWPSAQPPSTLADIFSTFLTLPPRHVRRKNSAGVDGGWAEGQACADPGARTPIGASGNFHDFHDWNYLDDLKTLNDFMTCMTCMPWNYCVKSMTWMTFLTDIICIRKKHSYWKALGDWAPIVITRWIYNGVTAN